MTCIQGICNPYKVSFEILPTYSELNGLSKMAIESSNNVNKHAGHELLAVLKNLPPRIKFVSVKFNLTDGSTWQFVHSEAVPMAPF